MDDKMKYMITIITFKIILNAYVQGELHSNEVMYLFENGMHFDPTENSKVQKEEFNNRCPKEICF